MAKSRQLVEGSKFSPWQVLDAANSYYALSNTFTSSLPRELGEIERSKPTMSDIAASATNRIFALELYLKAMLIGGDQTFPKDHDLKMLFDALPKDRRQTIKFHFDERSKLDAELNVCWQLSICFRLGGFFDDTEDWRARGSTPTDPSLSALLVRNRHGFAASRYIFQEAKHDKSSFFEYEYKRLAILCSILCEGLETGLPIKQPDYRRNFSF
jgi:hypothetical protein